MSIDTHYRILDVGEIIEEGDEGYNTHAGKWIPHDRVGGKVMLGGKSRRPWPIEESDPDELELVQSPKVAQGAAKTPLALIPPVAADAIARVHQNGAEKYGPWNWRESKVPLMTYLHAMRRHLDAVLDGQDIDPDSGLPHVAHVAASCNIILDAQAFGTLVDDRPPVKPKP